MTLPRIALALTASLLVIAAGCGDDEEATPTSTETTTATAEATVRVYFLRDGKVWPVARAVEGDSDRELMATSEAELALGPTDQEKADLGLTTSLEARAPSESTCVDIVNGFGLPGKPSDEALAQLVYTLTQFPQAASVNVNCKEYSRADFEDQTPAILVESPLPFEEVGSPLRVTGTANTFEATFQYTLTDTDGLIVDEGFVTATSGTGTRGTFDFTTEEYEVPFDGIGALIVYESSAKDGSRINLVEIPLRMAK